MDDVSCLLTHAICRAHLVLWMAKSGWPYNMINDDKFHYLMKTGRPHSIHIPSITTLSRDVKVSFIEAWKHVKKLLKVDCILSSIFKDVLTSYLGAQRQDQHCNRCVDIPKWLGIWGIHNPLLYSVGGHTCGEGKIQIRYSPMRIIWTQEKLFLSF
jgi:hypothetical protein